LNDAAAPTHEEKAGLLVLLRAKLCRLVGIEAKRFLQHLDRLFRALELFRVDLEDPVLGREEQDRLEDQLESLVPPVLERAGR